MATSYSNNKNFIVEVGEEYPYPSHVIAPHFVTVKLSRNDKYDVWKTQMLCLLRSHGMLGFIDGTIVRPYDDRDSSRRKFVKDRKKAWTRSDSLVTGWILGSLSQEAAMEVVNCLTSKHNNTDFTAKDAWDELQHRYGPPITETLRNLNPGAYTPRVTSIGPLHKEDKRLKAMEELKVTYMYQLFCETVNSTNMDMEQTDRTCVKEVLGNIERARDCYAPSFKKYDDFELAVMMVIDGCFILELLYRSEHGIMAGDPIFDNILVKRDVKYDLLLLENQIPFFILEILFQVTVKHILKANFLPDLSLTDLIFCFFDDMNILNSELTLENATVQHCHILGFLQSCYRPRATIFGQVPTNIIYSATEIAGAGVTFKPQRNSGYQLAVKFKQSPLVPCFGKLFIREASFKIPVLCIKYSTPSLLRNLIAYEQCYPLSRHYITSFAFLMDKLIDTKDDVSLLVKAKVLEHNLGACEDITNLFNNICIGVVLRDFYYPDEWKKLDAYCKRFWPKILISLSRIYKSTTWKTLTVIAAMAIFALTLLQTINDVRNP